MAKNRLIDLPIPVDVVNRVTLAVASRWPYMQPEDTRRIWECLLELYFFIQIRQTSEREEMLRCDTIPVSLDRLDNLWSRIHSKELHRFKINIQDKRINYNVLLDILESAEVIEIGSSYLANAFSKRYRPHPDINRNQTMILALKVWQRINRDKRWQTQSDMIYQWPDYENLIQTLFKTTIDIESAFRSLESRKGEIWHWRGGQPLYLDDPTIWHHKIIAIMINLGLHWFQVDRVGRVHTAIANLPGTLTPFILINGQPTVEIDAVNCQPLLLSGIIKHPEYQRDCESGRFYEKIAQRLRISRDETKLLVFSKIFFNNRWISGDLYSTLEEIWPGLPDQVNKLKCRSQKEAKERPESELLWHRLQSLESEIFIPLTLKSWDPILTRHDSYIVIRGNHWFISTELEASFRQRGLHAQLKITPEI